MLQKPIRQDEPYYGHNSLFRTLAVGFVSLGFRVKDFAWRDLGVWDLPAVGVFTVLEA